MVGIVLFVLLNIFGRLYAIEERALDPTCQNIHTYGYGYHQFYYLPQSAFKGGNILFNFSLSAPSDGHILLAENPNSQSGLKSGYEVVLGAGKNTFSEIRKYTNKKAVVKTFIFYTGLISPTQMRNFSISIKASIVSVSFMNNSQWYRILSWEDPSPLTVKYLSFCSWGEATGTWLFDCKGSSAIPEKMTPIKRLRKKLLSNYDPYSVPATDINKLTIDASVDIHYVSLDAKKSLLTTHGKFYFTWFDPRMQWNASDYDNITSINLLHREIWLPDFVLYNSQDKGTSPMEQSMIKVLNKGTVRWAPEAQLVTWCSLDLKNWPFDKHYCNISLGLNSYSEYVYVSLSSKNVKPQSLLKDSEWKIISLIGETTTIVHPWESDTSSDVPRAFSITIGLKRKVQMHVYIFILPTFVCIFTILAAFWLPIYTYKRFYIFTSCLFLLLLNIISLDTALPALPSSTPYLLTVNCNLFTLTVIHIIFGAYIISKVNYYEQYVSKFVDRIVTHPLIHSLFCLFVDPRYIKTTEENQINVNEGNTHGLNQWHLFGIILDRILFLFTIIYISIILII